MTNCLNKYGGGNNLIDKIMGFVVYSVAFVMLILIWLFVSIGLGTISF